MSYIVLEKNGIFYREPLVGETATSFFDVAYTNLYLSKYQDSHQVELTVEDVVELVLYKCYLPRGQYTLSLPSRVRRVHIQSCSATLLHISNETAQHLESLYLDYTNLTTFPEVDKCMQLSELTLSHSCLQRIPLEMRLPSSLTKLNLRYNSIEELALESLPSSLRELNLSYNRLSPMTMDSLWNRFPRASLQMQGRYKHTKVTSRNVDVQDIHRMVQTLAKDHQERQAVDVLNRAVREVYGSQSVHLSSVNKSVASSVNALVAHLKHMNLIASVPSEKECQRQFLASLSSTNQDRRNEIAAALKSMIQITTMQSTIEMNYGKLFCLVWWTIANHPQRTELVERLETEVWDSKDVCFTGRINRLVNTLVNYVDDVVVRVSVKEELQVSVQVIIHKLMNKEIDYGEARRRMRELFDQPYDEPISEEYKNAWIESIADYRPEPIRIYLHHANKHTQTVLFISYDGLVYANEGTFQDEVDSVAVHVPEHMSIRYHKSDVLTPYSFRSIYSV